MQSVGCERVWLSVVLRPMTGGLAAGGLASALFHVGAPCLELQLFLFFDVLFEGCLYMSNLCFPAGEGRDAWHPGFV